MDLSGPPTFTLINYLLLESEENNKKIAGNRAEGQNFKLIKLLL